MDLQGSLIDTCLRIHPSAKLVSFLKTQKFEGNIPENIRILVGKKPEKCEKSKVKPVEFYLNNKEIEKLKEIKSKLKEHKEPVTENNEKPKKDDIINKKQDDSNRIKSDSVGVDEKNTVLMTSDIDWLYVYIKEKKKVGEEVPYLHELLEGSKIAVPENKIIKRNPVLEARCVKLRAQQESREYRKMTKSVDNVRMNFPEDSISYQLKQLNRQLIAIGQFILSIFAGFLFGFKGVEWLIGYLDFGFRLLLGVMCALIIALAEIYFLAKKLNEELNVPETTQLGGPLKFSDEKLNENRIRKEIKLHQE